MQITEAWKTALYTASNMEEIMSILVDVIGLLAFLANALFALHIWSTVSTMAHRAARAR
ncbi:MAG: hypothetical protein JO141_27215 [Bradyrhizobium sp.]|nr:hypothetical protein [Bradyrhizobium sp.]